MTGDVEEFLAPTKSDYLRFLSAVVGRQISSIDDFPLTAAFLPFATPTWRLGGAAEFRVDGASSEAMPEIADCAGGVMGLGQHIDINQPIARYEQLRRRSQLVANEPKVGSSGSFSLVTLERQTVAGRGVLATQLENYAVRSSG